MFKGSIGFHAPAHACACRSALRLHITGHMAEARMESSYEAPQEVAGLLAAHPAAETCIDAASGFCWAFHRAELLLWPFQDGMCVLLVFVLLSYL